MAYLDLYKVQTKLIETQTTHSINMLLKNGSNPITTNKTTHLRLKYQSVNIQHQRKNDLVHCQNINIHIYVSK